MPRTAQYIEKLDSPALPPFPPEPTQIHDRGLYALIEAIAAPCDCEVGLVGPNGQKQFTECKQHPLDKTRGLLHFEGLFTSRGYRKGRRRNPAALAKRRSAEITTSQEG
jgi:hypothetical protein